MNDFDMMFKECTVRRDTAASMALADWLLEHGTEDQWWQYFEVCSYDTVVRGAYVTYLTERADPRAEGHRVLAEGRAFPVMTLGNDYTWYRSVVSEPPCRDTHLHPAWFAHLKGGEHRSSRRRIEFDPLEPVPWLDWDTRRAAADAAALAYADLVATTRAVTRWVRPTREELV